MIHFLTLLLIATVGGILVHSYPRDCRGWLAGIILLAFAGSSMTAPLW